MKKTLLIAIFIIGGTLAAQAQVKIGARFGINANTADFKRTLSGGEIASNDNPIGFHFGVFTRAQLPGAGFYIQPEILFNSNTTKFRVNNSYITTTDNHFKIRKSDLEIPVLAGFKILMFRLNAGPVLKVNIKEKVIGKNIGDAVVVTSNLKDRYIGYQAGVGIDLLSLTFDVRYNGNFTKNTGIFDVQHISSSMRGENQIKYGGGNVMFSIGYIF